MPKQRHKRPWALLIGTLVAALLWGSAVFALAARGAPSFGAQSSLGDVPGAPAIRPDLAGVVGVNLDASQLDSADLGERLARLDAGGIHWLRFRMSWDETEPERGKYQWDAWDRVFAAFAAHPKLQPVVVLDGSPVWARAAEDAANPLAPPQTRAKYGDFASAVARRYGAQVRYYQIWSEPNIAPHWGARPVDPADYLGLLREAAVRIRDVDPDAQIVLAGLAPNIEAGGANQSDIAYLDALYVQGGRAWFDIVAGEPFGFSQPPNAPADPMTLNFGRAALLHQVMVRHGDVSTPLWASAYGWNTLPSPWGQVTEDEQARYASDALDAARTRWPWLGPLFWATDCPSGQSGDGRSGFALCSQDGGTRPIWQALIIAATKPNLVLPPGEHTPDHAALHYSPGWRVAQGGADPSGNGDSLTFSFYGSNLALRVRGGQYWAYYQIEVDGAPANALPRDEEGKAYLVLADPSSEVRTVPVAQNLPIGEHQVKLVANGGWDQWGLQSILVSTSAPAQTRPVVWLILAVLATVIWGVLAWPWRSRLAAWVAAVGARVGSWSAPVVFGVSAALLLAFMLSPRTVLDLPLLGLLAILCFLRPPLLLPLIAASIPFWPQLKSVIRWQFSAYELLIWLGTGILILRWVLYAPRQRSEARGSASGEAEYGATGGSIRNGGAASMLRREGFRSSASAALSGLCTWISRRLGIQGYDWPVLGLLAVALASTLAAQRTGVALREFRMVFLDGALFYFLVTRMSWLGQGYARVKIGAGGVRAAPGAEYSPLQARGRSSDLTQLDGPARPQAVRPCLAIPWPVLDGLLLGMVCVSLLAVWQLGTGQGLIDAEGVWRVRGAYGSPNNLALVLDRAVPLALAVALFSSTTPMRRWLYGLAVPLMALVCVATFSKGALLLGLPAGFLVVLAAGAWRSRQRWPLLVLVGGSVLLVASLAVLFQTQRFSDLTNFQTGTSFIRLKLWQGAWHMALDHPWLGVGPDNFLYAYRTRYVLPSAWEELNLSHPHNILLDLWTRLGILGVIAGGWALAAAFRGAWRMVRRSGAETWALGLGLLAGLVAAVCHGLIDNSLFLIDLMALFLLVLALLQVTKDGESQA